jgi:hypothetical protein
MTDKKSSESRRKLLKSIAAGSGAIVAGKSLPESWSRPVVDSVMLPAHAMTSLITHAGRTLGAQLDTDSMFAEALDTLVPEAKASTIPPLITTYDHCIEPHASRTAANIVVVVTFVPGTCTTNAKFHLNDLQVDNDFHDMVADWDSCRFSTFNPRVKLFSLSGNAVGRFECGCGSNTDFDLPVAVCDLPSEQVCIDCPPAPSDIRLKTNIEALSISREGYNLYKFQYIDEDNENTYVGVMAQDIISRNPEAIVQNESGFYMVRYAQLGLKMVTLKQWESEGPDSVELMH